MFNCEIKSVDIKSTRGIRFRWREYLDTIPEEMKTPEFWMGLVEYDSLTLAYIPIEDRTYEICLAAVKQHGTEIRHVPEKFRTVKLCIEAIRSSIYALNTIGITREEYAVEVVKHNIGYIRCVPNKFIFRYGKIVKMIAQPFLINKNPCREITTRIVDLFDRDYEIKFPFNIKVNYSNRRIDFLHKILNIILFNKN